jgi:hypothetical protein
MDLQSNLSKTDKTEARIMAPSPSTNMQGAEDQIKRVQWRVKVDGTVYGPYPRTRLIEFLREGRISAHTELSCGADTQYHRADAHPNLRWNFDNTVENVSRAEESGSDASGVCNFSVTAHLLSNTAAFENVLNRVGKFSRAGQSVWVLRSTITLPQLRNRLSAVLGKDENFTLVNATEGRIAWFNLGIEHDTAIRSVWDANLND